MKPAETYPLPGLHVSFTAHGPQAPPFHETYELLLHRSISLAESGRPEVVGRRDSQECAFCGGTRSSGARFSQEKHTVPAGLGNRTVKSAEECDDCNQVYADCETALCDWLLLSRAFLGIRKRSGPAPKLKRGEHSFIGGQPAGQPVRMKFNSAEDSLRHAWVSETCGEITVASNTASPHDAVRSLARILWFFLSPAERAADPSVLQFIHQRTPIKAYQLLRINFPGSFQHLHVVIWKRRSGAPVTAPAHVLEFIVGSSGFVWPTPYVSDALSVPAQPLTLSPPFVPSVRLTTIKAAGKVRWRDQTIRYGFERRIPIDSDVAEDSEPLSAGDLADRLPPIPVRAVARTGSRRVKIATFLQFRREWLESVTTRTEPRRAMPAATIAGGEMAGQIRLSQRSDSDDLAAETEVDACGAPADLARTSWLLAHTLAMPSAELAVYSGDHQLFRMISRGAVPVDEGLGKALQALTVVGRATGQDLRWPTSSSEVDTWQLQILAACLEHGACRIPDASTESVPIDMDAERLETVLGAIADPGSRIEVTGPMNFDVLGTAVGPYLVHFTIEAPALALDPDAVARLREELAQDPTRRDRVEVTGTALTIRLLDGPGVTPSTDAATTG